MTPKPVDIDVLSEAELLKTRLCDLSISMNGTWLQECIDQLYAELEQKGLSFRPECYLADEWLTPEGETVIGIPFYLAHPALIKLERKMMLEAEGEGKTWCMQLLRHEAGHAFCYAYQLNLRKDWQAIFGSPAVEYGDTYKFKPYSRSFVRHLDGFYAQYHPDEDFVETFAVWLTPQSNWQNEYKGWKAFQKLAYVDSLMASLKGQKPLKARGRKLWQSRLMTMTLENFYKKKRRQDKEEFPDFHDVQLNKIFTPLTDEEWWAFCKDKKTRQAKMTGDELIRKYRKHIVNSVDRTSGERKYIIDELLSAIQLRTKQRHMIVANDTSVALLQLSVYVTSLIMNYVHTGWFHRRS